MRFPNGGRPPPARDDAGGGPLIERFPGQLSDKFNPHKRSAQKAQPIPRERLAYLTGRLHRLGPRPLLEFILEIEAGADLHERLERYAFLPADFIAANDGDRLPPARIVGGRRP
jgi:hypothetical protein